MHHRMKRLSAGRYEYRGRLLIQTSTEGPRGGLRWKWELAVVDKWGAVILDSVWDYPTREQARQAVDEEIERAAATAPDVGAGT